MILCHNIILSQKYHNLLESIIVFVMNLTSSQISILTAGLRDLPWLTTKHKRQTIQTDLSSPRGLYGVYRQLWCSGLGQDPHFCMVVSYCTLLSVTKDVLILIIFTKYFRRRRKKSTPVQIQYAYASDYREPDHI